MFNNVILHPNEGKTGNYDGLKWKVFMIYETCRLIPLILHISNITQGKRAAMINLKTWIIYK